MTINSSSINSSILTMPSYSYDYNGYSSISTIGDSVTVTTSSPAYNNQVYSIDTSSLGGLYEPEKRHHLKDEGRLPHDMWALMFNDGVLND